MAKFPTRKEIESKVDSNGKGATKALLEQWGVPWPPPKGWKKALLKKADELYPKPDAANTSFAEQNSELKISKKDKDAAFYSTAKWRRLRFETLERLGRRCGSCGWSPQSQTEVKFLVVDHIVSIKRAPERALDPENLQVLCNDCNLGKGSDREDDFRL